MSELQNKTQLRWRSPVAISAVLMLLFFVAKNWIGIDIPMFDKFIELLLAAGLAIGIFNNPTNSQDW